jgi:hypothetical protein
VALLRRRAARALLAGALAAWTAAAAAAEPPPGGQPSLEYQVKAAFVFNFAKFVDWPADSFDAATAPIRILVVDCEEVAEALEAAVEGQQVKGRPLVVGRAGAGDRLDDAHIVVVGRSSARKPEEILARLGGAAVLTVGDGGGFAARGGMVNFYTESNKVRFEVNPAAAEEAGLRISAKLLGLARIVRDGGREEP